MKAEIVSVGTELLLGDIVNTNAPYLARCLAALGIDSYYQVTVGDNHERLTGVLRQALERSDLVLVSGGLGPTMDDATKEAVAQVTERPLELHQEVLAGLKARYERHGRPLKENTRSQAYLPRDAEPIPNEHGSAPGLFLETELGTIVALPGPPRELEPMVDGWLLERLRQRFASHQLYTRRLRATGIGESDVEARLDDIIRRQGRVTIATYARPGDVEIRLAVKADGRDEAHRAMAPVEAQIRERLGDVIYGTDDQSLAGAVGELLLSRGETLAVAESCTGGLLGHEITSVPGSSRYFLGGIVVYANEAKEAQLEVPGEVLAAHGAVSAEAAEAMARGAQQRFESDWALSVTGIAGPDGGTPEKPVGTVYLGWAQRQGETIASGAEHRVFSGTRRENTRASVRRALNLLRRRLLGQAGMPPLFPE